MTPARNLLDLLLIGGGHAHLGVLMAFARQPEPGLRITLVARDLHTPYSGMLHGFVRGTHLWHDVHIDLGPLATAAGVRLVHDTVVGVDAKSGHAFLASGRRLGFDLVSVDCGIVPDTRLLATGAEDVVSVKPIAGFLTRWRQLERRWRASPRDALVVVGGGAAGIELAFAAADRLQVAAGQITVIDAAREPLPASNAAARRLVQSRLAQRGIHFVGNTRIVERHADMVVANDGSRYPAAEVLWAGVARAPEWLRASGLAVDADGFLRVQSTLRSCGDANVFGAGDIATMVDAPRPKAGVYAVRQGAPLAANLRAAARGRQLRSYHPQSRFLALIALGADEALAVRGHWAATGAVWMRLKRLIDERFLQRFRDWPQGMSAPDRGLPVRVQPRPAALVKPELGCGGCGAKLAADVLRRVLARLPAQSADGVLAGLDAADDAAVIEPGTTPIAVTVDGFRAPVSDPELFARLAVNHALSDAFAMNAAPLGVLAFVTVEQADETLQERDLEQMLLGLARVLVPLRVPLLGGHSVEGAELALGMTVLARVRGDRWFAKSGLRAGQVLVLTRPLGSGVLLAAAMRGAVRSQWLTTAFASMTESLAGAASALAAAGAEGATDVTGFGLLGHLAELARASGVGVEVDVASVPAYDGALDCLARGFRSQLEAANARVLADFDVGSYCSDDVRLRLLLDPQTCGGLVAGVDADKAQACVSALRASGSLQACVVGRVTPRPSASQVGRLVRGARNAVR